MTYLILIALAITGLHVCFWQGNILGWLRVWAACGLDRALGRKWSRYLQKPLWDCLPCMASVWGLALGRCLVHQLSPFELALYLLALCGVLVIVESFIFNPTEDAAGID